MFASIFLAMAAVILFSDYIGKTRESLGELATVLVADKDIAAGAPIPEDAIGYRKIPKKYLLDSLVQSTDELKGKIPVVSIARGAVITSTLLADNTIVTGDKRQVLLRPPLAVFDDQITVFDKVDLVVSYDSQDQGNAGDRRTTKVLLKDVTVNSVQGDSANPKAVGVVLTLEDSKNLIWALNYGKEVRVLKSGASKVQAARETEKKPAAKTGADAGTNRAVKTGADANTGAGVKPPEGRTGAQPAGTPPAQAPEPAQAPPSPPAAAEGGS
jgi:hypothetical protein